MILAATARSAAIGSLLALGACAEGREAGREIVWETERAVPPSTAQAAAGTAAPPGLDADGCREYTQTIRIGDEEHEAFGRACFQPDGSWRLHPPPQAAAPVAAQPVPVYSYPYYYPPPVFFGSAFFFSHRHHHHRHHHHGHRHFRHGGHRR